MNDQESTGPRDTGAVGGGESGSTGESAGGSRGGPAGGSAGGGAGNGTGPGGGAGAAGEDGGEDGGGRGGSGMKNEFNREVNAGELNFIEKQVFQLYQARAAIRRFACADGQSVPPHWEEAGALAFRGTSAEADALLKLLEEKRVLLLAAEHGAGKVRTALYLGWLLRQRERCTRPTVIADALDRKVRIDVRHLASRDRGLDGRLVVFPNALSRADPEVTRLFETTDHDGWKKLAEQLRARGAYLVFTTTAGDGGSPEELRGAPVRRRLTPHPHDVLADELERKLETVAQVGGIAPELLETLRDGRTWMLGTFHYAPQVFEFVDHYLELDVPGLDLAEAWRRMRNADGRILQDLDGDFEAWSFAFTLALAQYGGEESVAWVDVDRLHRHVRQWLRRDLNLRYPESREDVDAGEDADTRLEFADTRLLKRVRAVIDSAPLSHTVRFHDGAPPEGMWRAMFDRHRRALLTVIPGLRALAERGDEELQTLRVLAAQIIGRIGEMDPVRVTLPTLDRWAHSPSLQRQASLGALMDGVYASASERYRAACLRHLRGLQRADSDGEAGARLAAVIAAWSWVGDHDLALAMRELGAVARERLAPMMEDAQGIGRVMSQVARHAADERNARNTAVLLTCHTWLREMVSAVWAKQGGAFLAVQFSVSSLCITRGPVPVLREMRRWIADGGWTTGVVVALMFLHERGIADRLSESRVDTGEVADGTMTSCNLLLASLSEDEEGIRQTARFVGDLCESLATPFGTTSHLQQFCMESLKEHLADWVRDSLPNVEHTESMRQLFQSLATTHDAILRETLQELLHGAAFTSGDPRMRAFAASVQI